MKKMLIVLFALSVTAATAFAGETDGLSPAMAAKFSAIPEGQPKIVKVDYIPPISIETARKIAARPIQMAVIDKNGLDLDDEYAAAGLEKFKLKAEEIGLVFKEDGLPLVIKLVSVGTFTSAMDFEVFLDGESVGKFTANKGSLGARALAGTGIFTRAFATNTAWFVARANANAKSEKSSSEHQS